MRQKRIHELNEVEGYSYDDAIIIDKLGEESSKMMKLGKLIDIVISYQTIGVPILIDLNIPNNISIGESFEIQPNVTGSNLNYTLLNNPNFMSITEDGLITIEPDTLGVYNGIQLKISNIYGEHIETFSFNVSNQLPQSNKLVEYINPNKNKKSNFNGEIFVTNLKGLNNKNIYTSTFSKPRLMTNEVNSKIIFFDGIDDSLISTKNIKDKMVQSMIISYRPEIDEEGYYPLIGDYTNGHQIALKYQNNIRGLSFDGATNNKARHSFDGNSLALAKENVTSNRYKNNEWNYMYVEYETPYLTEDINIGTSYPNFSHGNHSFKGYVGGILLFNDKLTNDEINNFNNYLKSKYK